MDEDYKVIDNYLMIRMPAEVDHHQSVDISKRADRYIVSKQVGNVVFDFERTTFMDSSGIAVVLRAYRRLGELGGELRVCNIPDQAGKVLRAAGVDRLIPFE